MIILVFALHKVFTMIFLLADNSLKIFPAVLIAISNPLRLLA